MERHLQDDPSHLGREGTHADASTRRHLQYWMHHKPEEQRFGISATWPMTADWDKRNLILNSLGEFKCKGPRSAWLRLEAQMRLLSNNSFADCSEFSCTHGMFMWSSAWASDFIFGVAPAPWHFHAFAQEHSGSDDHGAGLSVHKTSAAPYSAGGNVLEEVQANFAVQACGEDAVETLVLPNRSDVFESTLSEEFLYYARQAVGECFGDALMTGATEIVSSPDADEETIRAQGRGRFCGSIDLASALSLFGVPAISADVQHVIPAAACDDESGLSSSAREAAAGGRRAPSPDVVCWEAIGGFDDHADAAFFDRDAVGVQSRLCESNQEIDKTRVRAKSMLSKTPEWAKNEVEQIQKIRERTKSRKGHLNAECITGPYGPPLSFPCSLRRHGEDFVIGAGPAAEGREELLSHEADFEPWAAGLYHDFTWRSGDMCCDEVIFEPWAARFQVQSSRALSSIVQQEPSSCIAVQCAPSCQASVGYPKRRDSLSSCVQSTPLDVGIESLCMDQGAPRTQEVEELTWRRSLRQEVVGPLAQGPGGPNCERCPSKPEFFCLQGCFGFLKGSLWGYFIRRACSHDPHVGERVGEAAHPGPVQASECASAAILGDAFVLNWGHACSGGDSSGVQHQCPFGLLGGCAVAFPPALFRFRLRAQLNSGDEGQSRPTVDNAEQQCPQLVRTSSDPMLELLTTHSRTPGVQACCDLRKFSGTFHVTCAPTEAAQQRCQIAASEFDYEAFAELRHQLLMTDVPCKFDDDSAVHGLSAFCTCLVSLLSALGFRPRPFGPPGFPPAPFRFRPHAQLCPGDEELSMLTVDNAEQQCPQSVQTSVDPMLDLLTTHSCMPGVQACHVAHRLNNEALVVPLTDGQQAVGEARSSIDPHAVECSCLVSLPSPLGFRSRP